jgi:acetylornithine/N-succinyldiaminopimelate aminotransferase
MLKITNQEIKELDKEYVLSTYNKNICFEKGNGSLIYDNNGKEYTDCIGGIATCSVGHNNKNIVEAIINASLNILNTSNLFYSTPQIELAKELVKLSKLDNAKCFLCNSGTECIEASIKFAKKNTKKNKIIVLEKCFHGRTLGSLSATWNPKYKEGFGSLINEFIYVPINNIEKLANVFNKDIAAIIIEPIQGEGGINECSLDFIEKAKELCIKNNALLIFDEIQCGNGRTGKYFCYENFIDKEGNIIKPNIVAIAKGLANGLPIGAVIADESIALNPGDHGSTFGGNNFCCTIALETIKQIKKEMQEVSKKEKLFKKCLKKINKNQIKAIKGKGLMIGIDITLPAKDVVEKCLNNGLVINAVQKNTLRFLPALTITNEQIKKSVNILNKSIKEALKDEEKLKKN